MRSRNSVGAKDHSSALKFVYKAQAVLLSCQHQGLPIKAEAGLATNLLTFLLLWKVRKHQEAYGYAQLCSNSVRQQPHHFRSAAQHLSYLNLTGIIVMAVAGCYIKVEKDQEKAIRTLENVLMELKDWEVPVSRLMIEMLGEIQTRAEEMDTSFEGNGRLPDSVMTI